MLAEVHSPLVYFARRARDGAIKIGVTGDLDRRLKNLRWHEDCDVTLLATAPGSRQREAAIHHALAASRLKWEWFAPTPEVMTAVESAGAILPQPADLTPGERFRAWRYRAELTRGQVASAVGVAAGSVVYDWEVGTRIPRERYARAIEILSKGEIPAASWRDTYTSELEVC